MTPTDLTKMLDECASVQQGRSDFQIDCWVIGQHATPEMRFLQLCLELEAAVHNRQVAARQLEKQEIELARLRRPALRRRRERALDAEILALELARSRRHLGAVDRELVKLSALWAEIPHFTREQIEANQPEYWRQRLMTNWRHAVSSPGGQGIIEAMEQAGFLQLAVAEYERGLRLISDGKAHPETVLLHERNGN